MIVKVRYKGPEQVERSVLCCELATQNMRSLEGTIFLVDSDDMRLWPRGRCAYCDKVVEPQNMFTVLEGRYKGYGLSVNVVDIDEGGVTCL